MLDDKKKQQLDDVIELQQFLGNTVNIIGFSTSSDLGNEIEMYIANKVGNGNDNYVHNSHTVDLDKISEIASDYLDKKELLRNELLLKVKNLGII